ncbi:hypothetical protein HGRIS_004090 [Hohenbuehelia grisea]|uniref:F-box domain-containing protein n=1 Tax=Hohenbuehelia grisea TaxID=104357 RepID=A0ABR3JID9_9AGAR
MAAIDTPPPNTQAHLSPEIHDIIISRLAGDRMALHACSLVCKDWAALTRPLLFSKLFLNDLDGSGPERCRNSLQLFTESPHLVKYIRRVHLGCGELTVHNDPWDVLEWMLSDQLLIMEEFPELLLMLTHVETLQLLLYDRSLSKLSDHIRDALLYIIQLPSLHRFYYPGLTKALPPPAQEYPHLQSFLLHCAEKLTDLSVPLMPQAPSLSESIAIEPVHHPKLQRLRVEYPYKERPEEIIIPITSTQLQSLRWASTPTIDHLLGTFTHRIMPQNLHTLTLTRVFRSDRDHELKFYPDLTSCVALRRVEIEATAVCEENYSDAALWATDCYKQLKTLPTVTSVKFDVKVLKILYISYYDAWEYCGWGALDSLVGDMLEEGSLAHAHIKMAWAKYEGPVDLEDAIAGSGPFAKMLRMTCDHLPRLMASPKAKIELYKL